MKYIKLFEYYNDIDAICESYQIYEYSINEDGSIDVRERVAFYNRKFYKLPLIFNKVEGNFICTYSLITNMSGFPKYIEGDLIASENYISSLESNFPKYIGGQVNLYNNKLTSLKGCNKVINGDFSVMHNKLKSLEYGPKIVKGDYTCSYNDLITLKGSPDTIDGGFYINDNDLTTLKYCTTDFENIKVDDNPLPKQFDLLDYREIKEIIKSQDSYGIWNINGSLNINRFNVLIDDLKNNN